MTDGLERQLAFVLELDKLKSVQRRSPLLNGTRRENSAEHSWHAAAAALVLAPYASERVNVDRVVRLLLVHDIVEIDAGDTFAYDSVGLLDQHDREEIAAARICGLLPPEQAEEWLALWHEFETQDTPEARFALAMDRLMPLLHNYHSGGGTWSTAGIDRDRVRARMAPIESGARSLWQYVCALIDDAVTKGFLADVAARVPSDENAIKRSG